MMIYKIFRAPEWETLSRQGRTAGAPVDLADGYIHFSTAEQALGTAAKHFDGVHDLVLAAIEADGLGDALRWEVSRGGALFPHLYRDLLRSEVLWHAPLPLHLGAHLFPEPIAGHIEPTEDQLASFSNLPTARPFEMLNLIRLRSAAVYPDGHPLAAEGLSGVEAYARYVDETAPILARFGGGIVWRGRVEAVVTGPAQEGWDHAFVVHQRSARDLLAMAGDPSYQAALVHRSASVRTSRMIRCAPADPAGDFR